MEREKQTGGSAQAARVRHREMKMEQKIISNDIVNSNRWIRVNNIHYELECVLLRFRFWLFSSTSSSMDVLLLSVDRKW